MTMDTLKYSTDDFALDARLRLEDLVDRAALDELVKSVVSLFGIPIRIFSDEGTILSDATSEYEVCSYVNTTFRGRGACASTVSAARAKDPGDSGDVIHPCFTGANYRIIAIEYDGRRIGRLVIGPYLDHKVAEAPESLLNLDPALDKERAKSLLFRMPRVKQDTVARIVRHLKAALDLIFFSGHKTLLTSQMHLASVKDSYHQLEEKTAKLQEAYDRLRELDRLKSNFLATVSHELRTPLTSIIGYSEMLAEGIAGPMTEEQADFVKTIHEKGEHLLSLIMSLLDLSKLESGTMAMRKKTVHVPSVQNEVYTTVLPNARKKAVEVKIDAQDGLHDLRGDPERLRQVVLNLVDNALKFTPPEGTVTMRARNVVIEGDDDEESGFALLAPARQGVEVRVLDTGIGIPEKERAKVFDPFYQVDSSSTREYGGTGLGLAIVKRIVEAHGGKISIEGNTPTGTVFVVVVPLPTAASLPPKA